MPGGSHFLGRRDSGRSGELPQAERGAGQEMACDQREKGGPRRRQTVGRRAGEAQAAGAVVPAKKPVRGSGGRAPEAGVRVLPSPFINLDKRGRQTPHPSLLPLVPMLLLRVMRKDFLDEVLAWIIHERP